MYIYVWVYSICIQEKTYAFEYIDYLNRCHTKRPIMKRPKLKLTQGKKRSKTQNGPNYPKFYICTYIYIYIIIAWFVVGQFVMVYFVPRVVLHYTGLPWNFNRKSRNSLVKISQNLGALREASKKSAKKIVPNALVSWLRWYFQYGPGKWSPIQNIGWIFSQSKAFQFATRWLDGD